MVAVPVAAAIQTVVVRTRTARGTAALRKAVEKIISSSYWIIDQQPTTNTEGSKHKECQECGETLDTQPMEKIRNEATTDSNGEAIVGGYLVTVTDTDTKAPVANARVSLSQDDTISIRLPSGRRWTTRTKQPLQYSW